MFWRLLILLIQLKLLNASHSDICNEELYMKQLPTGHVNTYFQFTTNLEYDSVENLIHTNLIPIPIAELITLYQFKELHVSLTHGLWRYDQWGYPPIEAAPGAEVWAWFKNNTKSNIDIKWNNLCSSLSGLLCASLNFIDETNTISPKFTFRPLYNIYNADNFDDQIRYGTLPHEIVCTENLTPWKKLLPCAGNEGLGFLLSSDNIYGTNYHSIGIHIREICEFNAACSKKILEVKQTVNLIFDPVAAKDLDWGLKKLFGHGLNGACTLANSSKIFVDLTNTNFILNPEPTRIFSSSRGGNEQMIAEYDIKQFPRNKMFGVAIKNENVIPVPVTMSSPLYAKRYLLGVGQERGQIVTKIMNNHWAPITVVLQENIPWFVPIYLHTLKLRIDDQFIQPNSIKYIPGELRKRPYHLEVAFTIPARKRLDFSIDFDYIFLKWLEYPPDANHGHYIGSAVLTAYLSNAKNYTLTPIDGVLFYDGFNASRNNYLVQIRTESLLITLPTPDFSMPYNVICLACTVVALAFGPIHNMATKKLVTVRLDKKNTLIQKLKSIINKSFKN